LGGEGVTPYLWVAKIFWGTGKVEGYGVAFWFLGFVSRVYWQLYDLLIGIGFYGFYVGVFVVVLFVLWGIG